MEREDAMKGFDEMAKEAVMWEEIREEEKPVVEYPLFPNPFLIGEIVNGNRE